MKQFSLLMVVFYFLCSSVIAQSKIEFGVTAEGSRFIPGNSSRYSPPNKNSFSTGVGVYASKGIWGKLKAEVGLMYRFKPMREYYEDPFRTKGNYGGYGENPLSSYEVEYSEEGKINGWKTYPLHYIVVPVHLLYVVHKNIFVRGGIEASWLTNYDAGKSNPEFNWTIGLGSQYHKLKWSVSYICGFKDVGFANGLWTTSDGFRSATSYRNNMIQFQVSIPLWNKK